MTTRHIILLAVTSVLALLWVGCGGPPRTDEAIGDLSGPRFETVWVDPQIVFSDTLFSLIRSNRVDSVKLGPDEKSTRPPASIEFAITEMNCNVSINLLDAYGSLVEPLLLQNLPSGFYRLTLHYRSARENRIPPGPYLLEADFCNRKRRAEIRLD